MASDIDSRLSQLRARRKVDPSLVTFAEAASAYNRHFAADAAEVEDWEKRGTSSQRWTRYAIGAMQSVGKKYTEVSEQTGERVASQLRDRLTKAGINAEFKLQGSVPLDVHIKRVSDVDVLAITTDFYTYNNTGVQYMPREWVRSGMQQSPEQMAKLFQDFTPPFLIACLEPAFAVEQ